MGLVGPDIKICMLSIEWMTQLNQTKNESYIKDRCNWYGRPEGTW